MVSFYYISIVLSNKRMFLGNSGKILKYQSILQGYFLVSIHILEAHKSIFKINIF